MKDIIYSDILWGFSWFSGHSGLSVYLNGNPNDPNNQFTMVFLVNRVMISQKWFGTPSFFKTATIPSRSTVSKALTKSTNTAQESWLCSCLFWSAIRSMNEPSEHPLLTVNPHCSSRPSSRSRSCNLSERIELSILLAASKSMIPRHELGSLRSPC